MSIRVGGQSPWDTIQHLTPKLDGVVSVTTASHGGVWLSPERARQLKAAIPEFTPWTGNMQWLEEDCDMIAALVMWPEGWPHVDRAELLKVAINGGAGSINGPCVAAYARARLAAEAGGGR